MKNLGIKLFSLAVALALNYYVNNETNVSVIGFGTPIEIKNVPDDKMLIWPLSPRAQITVRGPSYLVSQIATSNFTYELALPDDVSDTYRAELRTSALSLPPSVEVLAVEPAQLELTFDKKVKKQLPIIVPRYGNLPEDIKLVGMEVRPPAVMVVGPESILKSISGIETEPVDYRSLRADLTKRLALRSPGNLVSVPLDQVEVRIQLLPVEVPTSEVVESPLQTKQ